MLTLSSNAFNHIIAELGCKDHNTTGFRIYRVVSTKFSMQIEVLSVKRDLATIMKDAEIVIYVLGVKGIVQE